MSKKEKVFQLILTEVLFRPNSNLEKETENLRNKPKVTGTMSGQWEVDELS